MPVLFLLVLGAVHLGTAFDTHQSLVAATEYATRVAAMSGRTSPADIQFLAQDRLRLDGDLCGETIRVVRVAQAGPGAAIEVTTECSLAPPFGASFLEGVDLVTKVSATVTMPVFSR